MGRGNKYGIMTSKVVQYGIIRTVRIRNLIFKFLKKHHEKNVWYDIISYIIYDLHILSVITYDMQMIYYRMKEESQQTWEDEGERGTYQLSWTLFFVVQDNVEESKSSDQ